MSDTIHLQLSASADVSAALAVCERFGAVSSIELLEQGDDNDDESSSGVGAAAKVTFFDVRAASSAIETLGSTVAQAIATVRCRTVKLHGTVQFDQDDLDKVKGITKCDSGDDVDESYVLEFYDSRDAQKVQKRLKQKDEPAAAPLLPLPPGIEPPPGLAQQPPPQSAAQEKEQHQCNKAMQDGTAASCSTAASCTSPACGQEADQCLKQLSYQVRIQGLPNAMLTKPMMSAVLQQANLEPLVLGFTAKSTRKSTGEALVTLSSPAAAMWCVHHFNGCRWDANTPVTATLVEDSMSLSSASAPAKAGRKAGHNSMGAGAPEFVPAKGLSLSADAPAFVPGGYSSVDASPAAAEEELAESHGRYYFGDASSYSSPAAAAEVGTSETRGRKHSSTQSDTSSTDASSERCAE